jgi:hypothetical protein
LQAKGIKKKIVKENCYGNKCVSNPTKLNESEFSLLKESHNPGMQVLVESHEILFCICMQGFLSYFKKIFLHVDTRVKK